MLQTTTPATSDSLCDLFNSSQIPSEWKATRVIPVPKTSRARTVEDYRPIFILPIVAKVSSSQTSLKVP